jgi:hypothetical protein
MFPSANGCSSMSARMGMEAASSMNSRASRRVTFATLRIQRSHQSRSYENSGMRSRWIALIATVPPRSSVRSAAITTSPTGANVIAASRGFGGASS